MQIANETPIAFRSSAARPGALTLVLSAVREVWSRRRLIGYMVRAEVKKKGSNTVLGNLWWVIDPLLAAGVYVIVMSLIFSRSIPDFALFLLAALVPYKWFTATIGDTTSSVRSQVSLIKQIQFPKIVLPIVSAGAEVVNFAFAMLVVIAIMIVGPIFGLLHDGHLSLLLLWVPVIAAVQFVFSLGIAVLLSAVTVFYKDVGIFVGHLMRLLFWLSPVLWTFEALSGGRGDALHQALGDAGMNLLQYNPIAILLTAYRHVIYGGLALENGVDVMKGPVPPDLYALGLVLVIGIAGCIVGTLVFKRLEPSFAKVL
jgi:ABC-type polysaccharide/polyol phosphate export permease